MTLDVQNVFQWTNVWHQYFASFTANLISLSQGMVIGWLSPAIPLLASNSTPLSTGPLTNEEISWIGSLGSVGGLLGCISLGFITTRIGSRNAVMLLAWPSIAYFLLIRFGDTYYYLMVARFVSGWAGAGMYGTITLYISEIANDNIRGSLGGILMFCRNFGILMGYILGAHLDYYTITYISIMVPVAFVFLFMMLPSTPQHYLRKGKTEKAEDALKFYKGYKEKNVIQDEAFAKEFEKLRASAEEQKKGGDVRLTDFCNRAALKGLAIGTTLGALSQATLNYCIVNYATLTLEEAGISMNPLTASIILAVALIFGSLVSSCIADTLGRKKSMLISLLMSAFGLLATALYNYLKISGHELSAFSWIPVAGVSIVVFSSSAGIGPLSLTCSAESVPTKIRTYSMAIIGINMSLACFITLKLYPILFESIGLHICFLIFGIICIIGCIFIQFVLKETTGICLDDVGKDNRSNTQQC